MAKPKGAGLTMVAFFDQYVSLSDILEQNICPRHIPLFNALLILKTNIQNSAEIFVEIYVPQNLSPNAFNDTLTFNLQKYQCTLAIKKYCHLISKLS